MERSRSSASRALAAVVNRLFYAGFIVLIAACPNVARLVVEAPPDVLAEFGTTAVVHVHGASGTVRLRIISPLTVAIGDITRTGSDVTFVVRRLAGGDPRVVISDASVTQYVIGVSSGPPCTPPAPQFEMVSPAPLPVAEKPLTIAVERDHQRAIALPTVSQVVTLRTRSDQSDTRPQQYVMRAFAPDGTGTYAHVLAAGREIVDGRAYDDFRVELPDLEPNTRYTAELIEYEGDCSSPLGPLGFQSSSAM